MKNTKTKIKNQPEKEIKRRTQELKQKIIATIILFIMFIMVFTSRNIKNVRAVGDNTVLAQNVVAGSLALSAVSSVGFNNTTVGIGTNSYANLTWVNIQDYRNAAGDGAGWSVTGTATNFVSGGDTIEVNNHLKWDPGQATITGWNGADPSTGIANGTEQNLGVDAQTLVNAGSPAGVGYFSFNGTLLNLTIDTDTPIGTYNSTTTLTIA